MTLVDAHHGELGVKPACDALGVSRATWYRRRAREDPRPALRGSLRRPHAATGACGAPLRRDVPLLAELDVQDPAGKQGDPRAAQDRLAPSPREAGARRHQARPGLAPS